MSSVPSILFVCMGNICRSPAAEIIWSEKLKKSPTFASQKCRIDSAGTIAYHNGEPPDSRMQIALRKAGYTPFGRSRKLTERDLDSFDLIFAMDRENLRSIESVARSAGKSCEHCHLFLEYAEITEATEVPDPYYGGDAGFRKVIQLVEDACDSLLSRLAKA